MPSVLHIIKGLGRGGAERLLVNTIRRQAMHFRFHVIYFLTLKNQLVSELEKSGAEVNLLRAQNQFVMLLRIPKLIRMVRSLKPDIIHAHLPLSAFLASVVSAFTGIPMIYTEHNLPSRYRWATRMLHHYTIRKAKSIMAVSEAVSEDLKVNFNVKTTISLLENGIDTNFFSPDIHVKEKIRQELGISSDRIVVGTVAVFTRQKRLDRWLEICRKVHQANPETLFILAGHGPLLEELKSSAEDLISENVIIFTGLTEVPEKYLAVMDIYLMSSDYEGMPIALLEAMSFSLPVVVTAVGGIPSAIQHGRDGFLYAPDEADKAVDLLVTLCRNSELRKSSGSAARSTAVQRFDSARMTEQLDEIYRQVSHSQLKTNA